MERPCSDIRLDADNEGNVLNEPALQGRLVTVSTNGIGLGIAQTPACHGAGIMMNGFGEVDQIEQIQSGVDKRSGVRVACSNADIGKSREIATMAGQTRKEPGSLGLVVNNACIQFAAHIGDVPTG